MTLFLIILIPQKIEAADDWLGINGSNLDSFCGEDSEGMLARALSGSDSWNHLAVEVHYFILDLGQTYTIKKVKGHSRSSFDPIDIDIFVSDSKTEWGTAVATTISSWQDTEGCTWAEEETIDKDGQYIKVVINNTEISQMLSYSMFGFGYTQENSRIFDAYGDIAAAEPSPRRILISKNESN